MIGLLASREANLENTINFNIYISKDYYFDGILIKTLLNYAKSNLSITSIEKLFNIQKENYLELFEEVTTDKILKYIYFIPYDNIFDTERTSKIFKKIIIAPSKDIFSTIEVLNDDLLQDLKKFVNIVKRKNDFEHEQNNLISILLFYMHINRKRRKNSQPKKRKNEELKEISKEDYEKRKEENNVIKKQGDLFEKFIEDKGFTLKQLWFIDNEENDQLDYDNYKLGFIGCKNAELNYILSNFPKKQPLSQLVKKIKLDYDEEQKLRAKYDKTKLTNFESKIISKKGIAKSLTPLNDFGSICMIIMKIILQR